jgi:hypothetical protein
MFKSILQYWSNLTFKNFASSSRYTSFCKPVDTATWFFFLIMSMQQVLHFFFCQHLQMTCDFLMTSQERHHYCDLFTFILQNFALTEIIKLDLKAIWDINSPLWKFWIHIKTLQETTMQNNKSSHLSRNLYHSCACVGDIGHAGCHWLACVHVCGW